MSSRSRKRLLYVCEALAISLGTFLGLYPTLLTVVAILSLPALVLAIVGSVLPTYFDLQGAADPRGGYRRYVHVCAALCGGLALILVLNAVIHADR